MKPNTSKLHYYARNLRKEQTDAESKLWHYLRDRQLNNIKFRRQHPIGPYIVDFCSLEKKLIVELDGGQHAIHIEKDQQRTNYLTQQRYQVLRFWDHEVLKNTDEVLEQIIRTIDSPSPQPSP